MERESREVRDVREMRFCGRKEERCGGLEELGRNCKGYRLFAYRKKRPCKEESKK